LYFVLFEGKKSISSIESISLGGYDSRSGNLLNECTVISLIRSMD
jgi:hypothetical protein